MLSLANKAALPHCGLVQTNFNETPWVVKRSALLATPLVLHATQASLLSFQQEPMSKESNFMQC